MTTTYTVWIEVEEQGPNNDGTTVEGLLGFASSASFTDLEAAEDFATLLHEVAEILARSTYLPNTD